MRTILKYPLPIQDVVEISMPVGAKILHVDNQRGKAFLWAEVDTNAPLEDRRLFVRGTGNPFTGGEYEYIGTFFQSAFVWHVYE